MDEPTDGLHLIDIQQSLQLFNRMVEEGNSLILLEHHIDVIKSADWLIELGRRWRKWRTASFYRNASKYAKFHSFYY